MFGSPNSSPAYSPDASMQELYRTVNNAWKQSFFPASEACIKSQGARVSKRISKKFSISNALGDNGSENSNASNVISKISMDVDCPKCVAHVRLISISGGDCVVN